MKQSWKRTVIGAAAGLAALVGSLAYFGNSKTDIPTSRDFHLFPSEIPGAKSIEKHIIPDSKYCLVHIRQTHAVDNLIGRVPLGISDSDREVLSVQNDIYTIISHLSNEYGFTQVYSEGITPKFRENNIPSLVRTYRELENSIVSLNDILTQPGINSDMKVQIEDKVSNLIKMKDMFMGENATIKAYEQGLVDIKSIESAEIDEKLEDPEVDSMVKHVLGITNGVVENKGITDEQIRSNLELLTDIREDYALHVLSQSDKPYGLVVYGGGHVWGGTDAVSDSYLSNGRISVRDNISEWNARNPKKKFSLIEITPQSYD